MVDEFKIKLLQLRKTKKPFGFQSCVNGPLSIKGGKYANVIAEKLKEQFCCDASCFNWKPPPKAKVAVKFSFFSKHKNTAEIYNLVKYYLDLLKGPVFIDDRQVGYLEASIWRSGDTDSNSKLYISVKRLADYSLSMNLYHEFDDSIEEDKDTFPFHYYVGKRFWSIAECQADILSNSKISKYDRPGLKKTFPTMMQRFNGIDPLTLNFGAPPNQGGSDAFSQNIADVVKDFRSKFKVFQTLYAPIELDVQITQKRLRLHKDLDNIMIDLCGEIRKQLLYKDCFINGYRIYVVDSISSGVQSQIQLRFLPAGEIRAFNNRIEKALEFLEKKWHDELKI